MKFTFSFRVLKLAETEILNIVDTNQHTLHCKVNHYSEGPSSLSRIPSISQCSLLASTLSYQVSGELMIWMRLSGSGGHVVVTGQYLASTEGSLSCRLLQRIITTLDKLLQ